MAIFIFNAFFLFFCFVFVAEFQVTVAHDHHIRHIILSNVGGLVGA